MLNSASVNSNAEDRDNPITCLNTMMRALRANKSSRVVSLPRPLRIIVTASLNPISSANAKYQHEV
jgi:hypothetical protein